MKNFTRTHVLALVFALSMAGLAAMTGSQLLGQTGSNEPIIIDDGDASYSQTGFAKTTEPKAYLGDGSFCQGNANTQSKADYSFTNLEPGAQYDVYATWVPTNAFNNNVRYAVHTPTNFSYVNQKIAPVRINHNGAAWDRLATITLVGADNKILVTVFCSATDYTQADAMMLVKNWGPVCGNKVVQGLEECDDANTSDTDACTTQCKNAKCGDGYVKAGSAEQCDDGNTIDTDACTNACRFAVVATCGNGQPNPGEECDDGNTNNFDNCSNQCKNAKCGDQIVQVGRGEECDDGNTKAYGDGCTNLCKTQTCGDGLIAQYPQGIETCDRGTSPDWMWAGCSKQTCQLSGMSYCGNGFKEGGEECDDGNNVDNDSCTNVCETSPPVCGNNRLQAGETCDDGNRLNGDGCSSICQTQAITTGCGNGTIDPGEVCDNGAANVVTPNYSQTQCTTQCHWAMINVCGNKQKEGIELCDDGNSINTDACPNNCQSYCGNGLITGYEECDDSNTVTTDACTASCKIAKCGDGSVQAGVEACDDGNVVNTDSCTSMCQPARCGDGYKQGSEACDDGNTANGDTCNATCTAITTVGPTCGNGQPNAGEQCDDGNQVNTDSCTNQCQNARCGDGHKQGAEQCDDGNQVNYGDSCTNSCLIPIVVASCGNGAVEAGEQCDDNNQTNTDACTTQCKNAVCGDAIVRTGIETCDDGNTQNGDGCSSSCQTQAVTFVAPCGDFAFNPGEQCDIGTTSNRIFPNGQTPARGCSYTCQIAYCGNGTRETFLNEQCDDGNQVNTDSCSNTCTTATTTVPTCGNGQPNAGEQCDDGNQNDSDACRNNCTLPAAAPTAALTIRNIEIPQSSQGLVTSASLPAVRFTATAGNSNVTITNLQFVAQQGNISRGFWVVLKEVMPGDNPEAYYEGRYWNGTLQNGKFVVSGAVAVPANTTKNFDLEIYTQADYVNGQTVAAFNPQLGSVQLNFDTATANYVRASTVSNGVTTQLANVATNGTCGATACAIAVHTGPTIVHTFRNAGNLTITGEIGATARNIGAGTESPVLLRVKMLMAHEDATLYILPFRVQGGQAVRELSLKIDGVAVAPAILMPCSYLAPYSQQERDLRGSGLFHWISTSSASEFCASFAYPRPLLKRGTESIVEVRAKIKPRSNEWASGTKVRVSLIQDEHYLYAMGEQSMAPLRPKNTVAAGGNITYSGTLMSNEHTAIAP